MEIILAFILQFVNNPSFLEALSAICMQIIFRCPFWNLIVAAQKSEKWKMQIFLVWVCLWEGASNYSEEVLLDYSKAAWNGHCQKEGDKGSETAPKRGVTWKLWDKTNAKKWEHSDVCGNCFACPKQNKYKFKIWHHIYDIGIVICRNLLLPFRFWTNLTCYMNWTNSEH